MSDQLIDAPQALNLPIALQARTRRESLLRGARGGRFHTRVGPLELVAFFALAVTFFWRGLIDLAAFGRLI
jgi:hypothetical protein